MNINLTIFWTSVLLILASYVILGVYAIRTADKLRRQIALCDAERLKKLIEHYEPTNSDKNLSVHPLLGVIYSISDPKEHNHND